MFKVIRPKKWIPFSQLNYKDDAMKLALHPNYKQMGIIKVNYDASRFTTNHTVASDKYLYRIRQMYGLGTIGWIVNPLIKKWYDDKALTYKYKVGKKTHHHYNIYSTKYIKRHYPFMKDKRIDGFTLSEAKMNHSDAWRKFESTKNLSWSNPAKFGLPAFHRKNEPHERYQTCFYSYKYKGQRKINIWFIDRHHIVLPKLGRTKCSKVPKKEWSMYKKHQLRIGTVTIKENGLYNYTISMNLASNHPFFKINPVANKLAMDGYDLNITKLLCDTDGNTISNIRYGKKGKPITSGLNKILSKRHYGSPVYKYLRYRLSKLQYHISCQRHQYNHIVTTTLAKNHGLIVGEALGASEMHTKNKVHNANVQDVGWGMFIQDLKQKCLELHDILVLVNPVNTTQRCSRCGYVCSKKKGDYIGLGVEKWKCPHCKHWNNRDYNASVNILQRGIRAILRYLPKTLRHPAKETIRLLTHERSSAMALHEQSHQWMHYLVTHYYGIVNAKLGTATLTPILDR